MLDSESGERTVQSVLPQGQLETTETLLRQILDELKQPCTAKKPPPSDDSDGFWDAYDQEAEEFDRAFIERYTSDLDNGLIFAGLFSAVSTTFLGIMHPNLSPAPTDTTNALLMMIYSQLNNTTFPGQAFSLPSWDGPVWVTIWTQALLYASLSVSLLAALGAVLGKQWLRDYRDNSSGPRETRRKRRQLKVNGLKTWHFEVVLRAIPALLQISLLLFGTGLGGYLWTQQHTVAIGVVGTTCFGALFYIVATIGSYFCVSCPFTTPAFALVYHSLKGINLSIARHIGPLIWWMSGSISIQANRTCSMTVLLSPLFYVLKACLLFLHNLLTLLLYPSDVLVSLAHLHGVSVIDTSRFVFWLCETSLNPDAVFAAAKRIPDVPFPTDGHGTGETRGKLFRLVQDGLNSSSPSPSVLVYAKALTSLYFTAYARKFHISPFTGEDGSKEVAGLCHSVDVNRSQDRKSLLFLLTVLQQWFDIIDGKSCSSPIPEDKVIISELRTANINLDDVPDDVLEWFLHPLLHGLRGSPLAFYWKKENHRRHLFLQPLAIYIIRRLLPIDRPRHLPSHKTIATCLYVMIAILDWRKIDLEEIKITDNSDKIEMIFPRVLNLVQRPDITAAIQGDPNPTLQHPEVTSSGILSRLPLSIFSPSPRSRTFSETEVLHFRAILEPLARLVCEIEFRSYLEIDGVKAWGLDVFNATEPQRITDASIPAFCLAACCAMDDLLKSEIPYSRMVWGSAAPWKANVDASVLLGYLGRVEGTEIQNSIPPAYALLILSADEAIFTPETTASLLPFIISAMERKASPLLRHVGLKIAHVIRELFVNITEDVRDELLPALRSATFGNIQGDCIKLDDTSSDRFVHLERDLHYLEILFALAKSEYWLLQLRQGSCDHMQRCISMSKALHTPSQNTEDYRELSLRLVLIFSRIACAEDYAWPEWDIWFVARPDNQVLLANQAWKYPRILDECPDVVPLLITFTNKMLSSLDDVSEGDLAKLDKDKVIDALGGISEQVQMVLDARVDVDGMQSALEALGTRVTHLRDELLRKCVHSD